MFALGAEHILRPVREGDGPALARAYAANRAHLAPWEPIRERVFFAPEWQEENARQCVADAASGRNVRFVVESDDGEIRGRVNLNNIVRGAFRSADLGYWVDASRIGRGLASAAVACVLGFSRDELALHRVQAATLVHNEASRRVLAANGFEPIGVAQRYLQIAGSWQDHVLFQRLLEEPVTPLTVRP